MKSRSPVLQLDRLATARRLARAIRGELCCAVFLYGIGVVEAFKLTDHRIGVKAGTSKRDR